MILTDSNTAEYKAFYGIPEDFFCYRQTFPFGTCPVFRQYWKNEKGTWFHDTNGDHHIYIYGGRRYTWESLRLHLAEVWRPQSFDDRRWFCDHIAG